MNRIEMCSAYDRVLEALSTLRRLQSRPHPSLTLRFLGGPEMPQFGAEDAHLTNICHTTTACFAISFGTHTAIYLTR
jgi:hypothetical protein